MNFAAISASSSGDNTVISAVANKRIKVLSYTVIASGDVTLTWKSGASTSISGAMAVAANGGMSPVGGPQSPAGIVPVFQTERGEALVLNLSSATAVGGHITYLIGD